MQQYDDASNGRRPRVGICGGRGYMGGEALRLLLGHPGFELAWVGSREPGPVEEVHPNLYGCGLRFATEREQDAVDAVLLALPTEAAVATATRFLASGTRVVDLGAAFRLRDRAAWERTYGLTHPRWDLAERAVYGLPELHLDAVRGAELVANPGCFASAAILAFAPLLAAGLVDPLRLVVTGLSGTAGAGAEPTATLHHPEIGNSVLAYQAVGHRHTLEMEQELSAVVGAPVCVHFSPTYVPVVRGVMAVCDGFATRDVTRAEALACVRDYYREAPFVEAFERADDPAQPWPARRYPPLSAVAGTNRCWLGLDLDAERGRVVVVSVLDSVGKGGAQVGIENLNLMFGQPREAGLGARALHPG